LDVRNLARVFDVELTDDLFKDLYVKFDGPQGSVYEAGTWKVHLVLPDNYPYKSPSIGFCNKIFHPNIDERSGSVCLDVINQTWSPMYNLLNIFQTFLPQLLLYSNPADPLNGEAASMELKNKSKFDAYVREHVKKHAANPVKMTDVSMDTTEEEVDEENVDEEDVEDFSEMDDDEEDL
jgi:ubiquitin-protein ligase